MGKTRRIINIVSTKLYKLFFVYLDNKFKKNLKIYNDFYVHVIDLILMILLTLITQQWILIILYKNTIIWHEGFVATSEYHMT